MENIPDDEKRVSNFFINFKITENFFVICFGGRVNVNFNRVLKYKSKVRNLILSAFIQIYKITIPFYFRVDISYLYLHKDFFFYIFKLSKVKVSFFK